MRARFLEFGMTSAHSSMMHSFAFEWTRDASRARSNGKYNDVKTICEWQNEVNSEPFQIRVEKEEKCIEVLIKEETLDLTEDKAEMGTKNPTA